MSVEIFTANNGTNGTELWVTNGSTGSTSLLKDIMPGANSSGISGLFYSGSYVYFTADDGTGSGNLLWRTDGTTAGTVKLSSLSNGGNASNFAAAGGNIFFTGSDSVHGSVLFTINGETGAVSFVSTVSGSQFIAVGPKLFFKASDGTNGSELWSSDGTAAGTAIVKDIYPGSTGSNVGNLTVAGGKLFFSATTPADGNELWVSDGTSGGTFQVKDINSGANGSNPSAFYAMGSNVIFAADDGIHGSQLWISDGTSGGTHQYASNFSIFKTFVLGGTLYVAGNDGVHPYGLYQAFPSGLTFLSSNAPNASSFASYQVGSTIIFSSQNDNTSYSFDGTTFVKIADFQVGDGTVSGSQFFFAHNDGNSGPGSGNELWVSDGTANSAHRVSDINPGIYDSNPQNISAVAGGVVFTALNDTGDRELYFSNGTTATLVKNVNPTADLSPSIDYAAGGADHATASGKTYFSASDGVHGRELWESDGTVAGTHEVNDRNGGGNSSSPNNLMSVGGFVYFFADDGDGTGNQLHVVDPTNDSESRISTGFTFYQKFVLNGTLYYGASDSGAHGYGLWQVSSTGLTFVSSTAPNAFSFGSYQLGSNIIFSDHSTDASYSFDGTTLAKIADFRVGDGTVSGSQFFFVHNDGNSGLGSGNELWVSDGTANSAHRVSDINPGIYNADPQNVTSVAGGVVFTAVNETGDRELYFSNGTTSTLAANVNATQNPSAAIDYAANGLDHATVGSKTYFSASDNVHGRELWESDGTLAGTHEVNDRVIGATGSSPGALAAVGGFVYFFADDGDGTGNQLHVVDPSTDTESRISTGFTFYQKFVLNGTLYYGASDSGAHGYGLWQASPTGLTFVSSTAPNAFSFGSYQLGSTIIFSDHSTNASYSFDGTTLTKIADFRVGDGTVSGSQFFFVYNDGTHGNELGVTDGTANSAHLISDLNPGGYDSSPQNVTAVAGGVVFTANAGNGDRELYFSNGTTTTLAKNINATVDPGAGLDYAAGGADHATISGKTFFSASDRVHGRELWETDGTLAGTHQVSDQDPGANGSNPNGLIAVSGKIYFFADDGDGTGQQLHVVDPTTDVESRISTGFTFYQKFVLNGTLYYGASDNQGGVGHGYGLYQASPTGLTYVSSNAPYAFDLASYQLGSSIIFSAHNDNASYSFDGATFTKIADFRVGFGTVSGSQFFFVYNDGTHGNELGVTDGTANSAHLISDINPGGNGSDPSSIVAVNGGVLFVANDGTHGRELFFNNGTTTSLVQDIFEGSGDSNIQNVTVVGSQVFFSASDFSTSSGTGHGQELWVYNSTAGTASLVKDVISGTGSFNPTNFFSVGGHFYFTGDDGVHGNQLWTSDGTNGGTHTITASTAGVGVFFQIDGNHLAFRSQDATNGDAIYILDGTTGALTDVPLPVPNFQTGNYGVINGHFSFTANDGTNGDELYVFDGAATTRVTSTSTPNSSNISNLTYWNGKAYFTANDGTGTHGTELYVTDGTSGGTQLLKDIHTGSADGNVGNLMVVGNHLYFSADDGVHGGQLWTTDGTTGGTVAITSSTAGVGVFFQIDSNQLAFRSQDPTNGDAIYILNGTTGALTDVPLPVPNFQTFNYGVINGQFSFEANDGTNGNELYVFNGTATVRVTDIGTPNSSNISNLTYWNGKAYFTANDGTGTHGTELYVTDGTSTSLLKDIHLGGADGGVGNLMVVGNHLYFNADDGTGNGSLLWTTDGTSGGTHALTTPALGGTTGTYFQIDSDHLAFRAHDSTNGDTLYILDGTTGTLTNVPSPVPNFQTFNYGVVNGQFSFEANDGVNGNELYVFDGTHTTRVTDTNTPNSSGAANFTFLANVAPTVTGAVAGQAVDDKHTISPFTGVTIADADSPAQTETVTIALDDASKGTFTAGSLTASGFAAGATPGTYTFVGTAANATTAIHALVFSPAENRQIVGATETTTFTVNVDDGSGGAVTNTTTTVVTTSVNDAPAPLADSKSVNEDATASALTRITGVLANDTDPDVGTAAPFVTANLVVNGGAESGSSAHDVTSIVAPQGWTTTSNFTAVDYGLGGGGLTAPSGGGSHYFAGGPNNGSSTATQTIDVSAYAASIDGGTVSANLSGLFGGFGTEDDHMDLRAVFLDSNNQIISTSGTVGDVTSGDRGNVTELLAESGSFTVPGGTRSIQLVLTSTESTPNYNDGYADNLSLTLSSTGNRETSTLTVTGAHFGAAADSAVPGNGSALAVTGTYGILHIHNDGTYDYAPNTAAAEALNQGAPATDVFHYTASDVHGATTASTLTFNITGQNDVPVMSGAQTDSAHEGDAATGFDLLRNASDVDTGETATLVVTNVTYAVDGGGASGTAPTGFTRTGGTLNVDPTNATFDHLALNATETVVVSYDVQDVQGTTVHQTDTVTIIGTNDAPVGVNDTASATEAGGVSNGTTGSGASGNVITNDTDVDTGDTRSVSAATAGVHTITVGSASATNHGTITLNANGSFSYTVNDGDSAVQALRTSSDTLVDSITYTVQDNHGATATATLDVTIHGANDAPTAINITGAAQENTGNPVTLTASYTDVDTGDTHTFSVNTTGTVGAVTNNNDGTFSYDPNGHFETLKAGATATDTFAYTVTDGSGLSSSRTATVTITGENDAPTAAAITGSASENTGNPVTLTASYTDVDVGDTHTFSVDTTGTQGTVVNNSNGTFSYNPNGHFETLKAGATATDVFHYTVTDGSGATSTQTATVTITGENDAPVAAAITGSANEDTGNPVTLTASYTDIDVSDTHTFSIDTTGTQGTVVNNNNGTFSYNPNGHFETLKAGAIATDTFHYTVTDGSGATSTQTATVTITGENDAPVAAAITGTANEDTGNPVTLTAAYTDVDASDTHTFSVDTTGTLGTVVNNNNGTFGYNPNGQFEHLKAGVTATDVFHYTVTDGSGATSIQTATVTITGENDTPVAVADTAAGTENQTLTIDVLANDTDVDDAHTFTLVSGTAPTNKGSVSVVAGQLVFNPGTDFDHLATGATEIVTLNYTMKDEFNATSNSTVSVTITGTNDAPVVSHNTGAGYGGGVVTITQAGLETTDVDNTAAQLTYTVNGAPSDGQLKLNGTDIGVGGTFTQADINAGHLTYTHAGASTADDGFSFIVSDGADSATGAFILTANQPPSAPVDTSGVSGGSVTEGAAQNTLVGITASSTDPEDGSNVTYSLTNSAGGLFQINATTGVVTVSTAGATGIDYESAAGHAYTITVQAADTQGSTSAQNFTIGVTDAAPTVPVDSNGVSGGSVSEGAANGDAVGITASSTDVNGGTFTWSLTDDAGGRFSIDPSGVVHVANATLLNFESATSHNITIKAADASGAFNTQTFAVAVTNVAPVATADSYSLTEDNALTVAAAAGVLINDSDVHGGTITAVLNTGPAHAGSFGLNADGSFHYTPTADFNGADSFTYHAFDGTAASSTVTVNLTVSEVNDVPVANTDTLPTVAEDAGLQTITFAALTGNDTKGPATAVDETAQALTVTGVSNAVGGTVQITGGHVEFTPTADFNGAASFDYTIQDNGTTNGVADPKSATGHASFTITAVNDAPTATNLTQPLSFAEDAAAVNLFTAAPVVADIDSTTVTATLTLSNTSAGVIVGADSSAGGVYTVTGSLAHVNAALAALTFDSAQDFNGTANVAVAIDDGHSGPQGTNPAGTVSINVGAVNDAPVNTVPGSLTALTNIDHAVSGLSVSDVDATSLTTTLHVDHGTLAVAAVGGGATVGGSGTDTVTLTGSVAQVDATLAAFNNVLYHSAFNFNGTDHLTMTSNDGGGTGAGGALSDTDMVAISVLAEKAGFDADANGHSDILWHNDNGADSIWDNGDISAAHIVANPGAVASSWHIAGTADFDGNGHSDILWRNDNGALSIWDDSQIGQAHIIVNPGVVPGGWHIAGTGDFDGNGHGDILWQNDNGAVSIWDNGNIASAHVIANAGGVPSGWHIAGTGDFDGNGHGDILWQNDNGAVSIWDNGNIASAHIIANAGGVPSGWHIAGSGDFDGNGHSDILWQNTNGAVSIWDNGNIASAHIVANAGVVPSGWHIAGSGDFDGNGKSDILWRNDNGAVSIWDNAQINNAHIIANAGVVPDGWHIV